MVTNHDQRFPPAVLCPERNNRYAHHCVESDGRTICFYCGLDLMITHLNGFQVWKSTYVIEEDPW